MNDRPLPRWSLFVLCSLIAVVGLWAATVLPWRAWTTFAIFTTAFAASHAITAGLALVGHPKRGAAWRVQAMVSLAYLAYLTWNLLRTATYVAVLYGSLGQGVAVALMGVVAVLVLLTVPLSVWGLALTGGIRGGRAGRVGVAVGIVAAGIGILRAADAPQGESLLDIDPERDVAVDVAGALPEMSALAEPARPVALSAEIAARCPEAPRPGLVTVVAAYASGAPESPRPASACVQAPDLAAALADLRARLQSEALAGPIKIDVLTRRQDLEAVAPVADGLIVRPAVDGVCEGERCLMPWQLVALDQFRVEQPLPFLPDLRFGLSPGKTRMALAWPDRPERTSNRFPGLARIETASFVVDGEGRLHRLRHGHDVATPYTAAAVKRAVRAAERYILDAAEDDGRFAYNVDPTSGHVSMAGFALARQAGTTLVLCELAEDPRAEPIIRRALAMMAGTEVRSGELGMLVYPPRDDAKRADLGPTALATIALLSCHDRAGHEQDATIARLTRFLLAMQREDGGFYPAFDLQAGKPIPGPDPLYAVGQAVYALTLLERLQLGSPHAEHVAAAEVHAAVDRAMTYTADTYWQGFVRDFFWMEENWHCLAARASLGHHRHEGYERFCLDYVQYKKRLLFDEGSEVDPDWIGGWGFGNVLVPHNTAAAGFGEALAAAMALGRARGEEDPGDPERMASLIRFLLRMQHDEVSCFACSPERTIVGGFSEHAGSPVIRIDYVQHAMAAMGHGGRMIDLFEGSSVPATM